MTPAGRSSAPKRRKADPVPVPDPTHVRDRRSSHSGASGSGGSNDPQVLLEELEELFPAAIERSAVRAKHHELRIKLPRDLLVAVCTALRDKLSVEHCTVITAVDWIDRWQTVYHLFSYSRRPLNIEIVVDLPRDEPWVDSITPIYGGANWHEREAFDLMGLHFRGHPDQRRILLPDWWDGHPLRKDYLWDMEPHKIGGFVPDYEVKGL